jgi:ABC-type sulfate transport system permease subunit
MNNKGETEVSTALGMGTTLAMVISYVTYKSIGWAILHGIFGWFYVIYYAIKF